MMSRSKLDQKCLDYGPGWSIVVCPRTGEVMDVIRYRVLGAKAAYPRWPTR